MNDFGVPMNDAEMSMQPPGAIKPHEKMIAESGVTSNIDLNPFNWFKGGNDAYEAQEELINSTFDYNNEMWSWHRAQDWSTYYATLERQYVDQLNDEAVRKYKDQLAYNNWQDKENMRLYSYAKEVEAYNASVNSYYQQLDFNNIAEELTINDTARVYQDQLISLGFQNEDLINKYLAGEKSIALEAKGLTDKLNQAKAVETLQIRETDIGREFDLINNELDKVGLRNGMAATKADAAFKIQGMRTETLEKVGQQKALGQVGRSAEKAMQAILAKQGNAQAALMNSISNAEAQYTIDLKKLSAALENKTALSKLQYDNIANQLTTSTADIRRAQESVGLKFSQLKDETDFGREQLQQSMVSAENQYLADRERIGMDKYQADINASQSLKTVPTAPPQQKLPLMIPDTVYNKPLTPVNPPFPMKGVNTVQVNSFGQNLMNLAIRAGTAYVTSGASELGRAAVN
tara:strand:- start:3071 stop:4456 length:1386 start_codon:yes stop_codon:yes gene_type:complete